MDVEVKVEANLKLIVWNFEYNGRLDVTVDEKTVDLGVFKIEIPDKWLEILRLIERSYVCVYASGSSAVEHRDIVRKT